MTRLRSDSLGALVRAARSDAPDIATRRAWAAGPVARAEFLREAASVSSAGAASSASGLAGTIKAGVGALVIGVSAGSVAITLASGLLPEAPSRAAPMATSSPAAGEPKKRAGGGELEPRSETLAPAAPRGVAPTASAPDPSPLGVASGSATGSATSRARRSVEQSPVSSRPVQTDGADAWGGRAHGAGALPGASPPADAGRRDSAELVAEAELIDAARRALRDRPALALSLAREHELRFPSGHARTERLVITIDALAALGRAEEARRQFRAFEAAEPNSLHLPRLRRALRPFFDAH